MASPQIDASEIVETLETIRQRGHSAHTVLGDWVNLMLYALQRRDDPYLEIVDSYREERDIDHPDGQRSVDPFSKTFGQLQEQMAETDTDVLGGIYEKYGMSSDASGQYFTPHNVCELMAETAGITDEPDADAEKKQTVADPACGSGRMLLVAGRKLSDPLVVGQDKDPLCARMAALNCCFLNLDSYIIHGDSLTIDFQRAWETSYSPMGGGVRELDEEEISDLHEWVTDAFESTGEDGQESESTAGSSKPPMTESVPAGQVGLDAF